jgi:hypothetical protein
LGTAAIAGLLYQPRMIGGGDCGEIGGMKIGKGNRSTQRKPELGVYPSNEIFLTYKFMKLCIYHNLIRKY